MTNNPFPYTTLTSKDSIRLVALELATQITAQIHCSLITTDLTDAKSTNYQALSYVWGDPSKTSPISLSGQDFQVTLNLESALRHIRKADEIVLLWVDAICINQSDLQERSSQVGIMRDIYREATGGCILWLGDASEDHDEIKRGMEITSRLKSLQYKDIEEAASKFVANHLSWKGRDVQEEEYHR